MGNRARLALDAVLLVALLVAFYPGSTGISVHEWLSLALTVPLLVHLVINWDWVVRTSSRLLCALRAEPRVNLVIDAALFVVAVTVMLSGGLISRAIANALGAALSPDPIWHAVHSASATVMVALLAVHAALHVPWALRVVRAASDTTLKGAPR